MKRFLILALLLAVPGTIWCQSSTLLIDSDKNGTCSSAAKKIKAAILERSIPEPFDLLVICETSFWQKVVKAAKLPENTLAFTALYKDGQNPSMMIPASAADKPLLSVIVRHELRHIQCRCRDGD